MYNCALTPKLHYMNIVVQLVGNMLLTVSPPTDKIFPTSWPAEMFYLTIRLQLQSTLTYLLVLIHRESKKGDTIVLSISLLNIDRFSQFFHWRTQLELCNKIINKDPTSPRMCCYTTLWNVPTRQCTGAQDTWDNQAAATGDACIHLTWSVASE